MEAYSTIELPSDVPGIGYTLRHRIAVDLLIDYHCKRVIGKTDELGVIFTKEDYKIMHNRGICHDMDKICCGLSYPQLTVDYFHRMFNGHHIDGLIEQKSKYDWIEMVMDWESAAYTKPDKGKNAYGVATSFNKDIFHYVAPYLKLFEFDSEQVKLIEQIKDQIPSKVYEKDMIEAILRYIHTTHIPVLSYVSRLDDAGFMRTFNRPTPFRHKQTQRINGNYFNRPNKYVMGHKFSNDREMVKGMLEAQIFDMDMICKIPATACKEINAKLKGMYTKMLQTPGGTR